MDLLERKKIAGLQRQTRSKRLRQLAIGLAMAMCTMPVMAADPPTDPALVQEFRSASAGTQLSQTRQYLERQRIARQLAEQRTTSNITGAGSEESNAPKSDVTFQLNEVAVPISKVLSKKDIDGITAPYIGKMVTLDTLYKIVEEINKLYETRGYITCKAYLEPQRIKNGRVSISLIEGVNGKVYISGNQSTAEHYIKDRIHLEEGKIPNLKEMNADLLRFNGTNDAQARIALKPGTKEGTTDYDLVLVEPQKSIFGLIADNMGNESTGLYRGGFYWNDRSLTGVRDNFVFTNVYSRGSKSGSLSYTRPIDHQGTKLNVSYSANSTRVVSGPMEPLDVLGHGSSVSLGVIVPIATKETVRSNFGVSYGYQHSVTDYSGQKYLNDTIKAADLYYDQTDYGRSTVFYQRHGYRFGLSKRYRDSLAETYNHKTFGKYVGNFIYQRAFAHGQMLTSKMDLQISNTNYLPSAEQFYIGGAYSVRGYKESALSGDSGMYFGLEYAWPLTKKRNLNGFIFLDSGRVWGESSFDDHLIWSTGFGVKASLGKHHFLSCTLGLPMVRELNGTETSKTRFHISYSGQF